MRTWFEAPRPSRMRRAVHDFAEFCAVFLIVFLFLVLASARG